MNRYLLVCAKITIKEVKKQKCEEREINEPRPNLKVNANYRLRIYWFLVHSSDDLIWASENRMVLQR